MFDLKENRNKNNYLNGTFIKNWYADFFLHFTHDLSEMLFTTMKSYPARNKRLA